MDDRLMTKAAQPRHHEMAQQVSREMIENFSSKEQKEMLDIIQSNIVDNYDSKILETQKDLETLKTHKDTFLGNPISVEGR